MPVVAGNTTYISGELTHFKGPVGPSGSLIDDDGVEQALMELNTVMLKLLVIPPVCLTNSLLMWASGGKPISQQVV
jgi:hypothetical protein